jgi:3-phosphoglycerate kinase
MLATLGDVYVNDAFGSAHRAHSSTTQVAKYFASDKKMFGYLMDAEVTNAEKVLHKAEKPFTAIVGGAKVSDKILILENLLLSSKQRMLHLYHYCCYTHFYNLEQVYQIVLLVVFHMFENNLNNYLLSKKNQNIIFWYLNIEIVVFVF